MRTLTFFPAEGVALRAGVVSKQVYVFVCVAVSVGDVASLLLVLTRMEATCGCGENSILAAVPLQAVTFSLQGSRQSIAFATLEVA